MSSVALATLKDRHLAIGNSLARQADRLNAIIPQGGRLNATRAIGVVMDALGRDPSLLELEPKSVIRAVMHAAEIGLELGSPLGEAYLVPFKGKATMMIGYRGFVHLIRQSPRVTVVKGVLVREGDDFEVDEGANTIRHKLGAGQKSNRGPVTHAYSRVYYSDGSSQFEVMDREELDAIKAGALSRSRGFSPWKDPNHADEMMKKCPLRRQAKWLELSAVARRGSELDDLAAMQRGEIASLREKDGTFSDERAATLKTMLSEVQEAEYEEEGTS